MIRNLLAALGTLVAIGVALLALDPTLAEQVPVDSVVAVLGNDYVFVALFGAVALALVFVTLGGRALSGLNQATPPRPEAVQPAPRFGSEFDEAVDGGFGPLLARFSDRPSELRERLREDAIQAEIAASSCRRSAAEQRVDTGAWTDDEDAAVFLNESASPSVESRLRAAVHGEAWFQRGARRTANAVVAKSGECR